jgi:L-iditol 2-dehydrogenase
VLIGMGTPIQTLPISDAALREVDLIGSFRYVGEYAKAISILSGKSCPHFSFENIITQRFKGFENIVDAFEAASKPKDRTEKMVLKVAIDFE